MITLCLIVRDEELCLEETIRSCSDDYDELVVVDTGSEDRTVEIAHSLGATVHSFVWCDDFSAARNFAMEKCSTEWIFMIDADEMLHPDCRGMVRSAVELADAECGAIKPLLYAGGEVSGVAHYCDKIFRRGWGHWVNPSHNVYTLTKGVQVHFPQIKLLHQQERRGVERREKRSAQRNQMNESNFRKKLQENPNDTRATWYLALTLAEAGKLEESITWWKRYLEIGTWGEELYETRRELAEVLLKLGRVDAAVEQLVLCYKDEPRRAEAAVRLGDMFMAWRAYKRAAFWFRVAAAIPDPVAAGCTLFMQPRCYGEYPQQQLQKCDELLSLVAEVSYDEGGAENINTQAYWDEIYRGSRDIGTAHRKLLGAVSRLCPERSSGQIALDVGSGTGNLAALLRNRGWDCWSMDFSNVAVQRYKYTFFGDVTEKVPLPKYGAGKYHLITAVSLLEHLQDPQQAVKNMVAALAPGGHVVISVPLPRVMECEEHLHEIDRLQLETYIKESGLHVVDYQTEQWWQIVVGRLSMA